MTKIVSHQYHDADRQKTIRELVGSITQDVEGGKDVSQKIVKLTQLSGHSAISTDFEKYWSWTSLEELASLYCIKTPPRNVKLAKQDVVELFGLARKHVTSDAILKYYSQYLDWNLPYDGASNLLFYPPPEIIVKEGEIYDPTPEQLADIVLNAKPIQLP